MILVGTLNCEYQDVIMARHAAAVAVTRDTRGWSLSTLWPVLFTVGNGLANDGLTNDRSTREEFGCIWRLFIAETGGSLGQPA